ncbi:hypothetical protein QBC33DRAFT_370659 [Phialemonium atrogriseum]|uniref:Uncharacterized protein n=1 Tax=Phialemonium atrogriseum TaxID=1093897 RepID=A0AAJ0C409_9PEZI|nr:uncharacterized protein QBC33DRAFT_370659 [Phialemonium atrogriseum]KAK1768304.1 hypothetical protein QBC33DRAFT_370659 [Phialemonium atrogriseum]
MSASNESWQDIREALNPYIRPREEAAYIRRVLALHLDSCVKDDSVRNPLALVESTRGVKLPKEARGVHEEYLKALSANISARAEHGRVLEDLDRATGARSTPAPAASDRLEEHLARIKLQKRKEKLQVLEKYLDLLCHKPVASPNFLDPEEVFMGSRALPSVPKEVVDGLAQRETTGKTDLKDLIDRLEKQVLRAKLLLKGEEQLLEDIKARSTVTPGKISESAKLRALNTTRDELINWIETELAKASGGEPNALDGNPEGSGSVAYDGAHVEGQLASIKEKYAQYLTSRKSLLQLVGQQPQPEIQPQTETQNLNSAAAVAPGPLPAPVDYLLTPYLEKLIAVAHEQKALIGQKSHLNIAIAKQLKDNCQALDHLAEESHLLPSYPMPGASKRKLGFGDALVAPESLDSSSRVKPWVFAADSAKIATLETVAEKIEEGQLALESTMKALNEIDLLLGRGPATRTSSHEAAGTNDDDIWLAEGEPPAKQGKSRKHAEKPSQASEVDDIWSILDGNLGLLRSENELS